MPELYAGFGHDYAASGAATRWRRERIADNLGG